MAYSAAPGASSSSAPPVEYYRNQSSSGVHQARLAPSFLFVSNSSFHRNTKIGMTQMGYAASFPALCVRKAGRAFGCWDRPRG